MQIEPDKNWDVCVTKDVAMCEAVLNMNEDDELWIFVKSQVVVLCKLVTSKSSDDILIDSNSEKILWQNVDGI